MATKIPPEYTAIQPNDEMSNLNGTDIYLTVVTAFISSAIVHTGITTIMSAHNLVFNQNILYTLMAITSLLASHNCLMAHNNQRFYRQRVWNAINSSLNIVFISPFTIWAQIAQTVCSGFTINRNIFD